LVAKSILLFQQKLYKERSASTIFVVFIFYSLKLCFSVLIVLVVFDVYLFLRRRKMKVFVSILFVLLSISFVAEHVVCKYMDAGQALALDEEAGKGSEEERQSKAENDTKVQYMAATVHDLQAPILFNNLPVSYYYALLSSGYINKPYTPPDFC
jgi:hypothetical protein